jgi:hypothetical protein
VRGGHYAEREREYECASYCKDFRRGFHGRHRSCLDFRTASQFEKEKSLLSPAARARARLLRQGRVLVSQPSVPTALAVELPFPPWATNQDEVAHRDGAREAIAAFGG